MSGNFWTEADDRHKEIARTFYEGIERTHPHSVTSKRMCPCLEYVNLCGWAATSVDYYEYRGPDIGKV